jgi:hypothetical protein
MRGDSSCGLRPVRACAGETRETVDMMAGLAVLVEQYLGKQSRAAVRGAAAAPPWRPLLPHLCTAARPPLSNTPHPTSQPPTPSALLTPPPHTHTHTPTLHLPDSRPITTHTHTQLFRTWGSVLAMLPVGGPKVWGNATFAPDDDDGIRAAGRSYG